jgi:hypothetical protein
MPWLMSCGAGAAPSAAVEQADAPFQHKSARKCSALLVCAAGTKKGSNNPVTQSLLDFFDDITEGARDGSRRRAAQASRPTTALEQQSCGYV